METISDPNIIGQKAFGIQKLNQSWTLPYIIIDTSFYKSWKEHRVNNQLVIVENSLNDKLSQFVDSLSKNGYRQAIIRSSAKTEDFDERGEFESVTCNLITEEITTKILEVWSNSQVILAKPKHVDNELALIVQAYIQPKKSGHFSNERRVSRNSNNWTLEIYDNEGNQINNSRINIPITSEIPSEKRLDFKKFSEHKNTFNELAKLAYRLKKRCHFEWIWEGNTLYVVQCDIENDFGGTPPGSEWSIKEKACSNYTLKVFVHEKDSKNNWTKALHVKTFRELGFSTGDIFILEIPKEITLILQGHASQELMDDLNWLLEYPIVIRTSHKNNENHFNLNLPRTETIFNADQALEFLRSRSQGFIENGLKEEQFSFLVHRFIISKACALALSKPNSSKVRIDSSWGLPDGLGYNPYDTFEIDISSPANNKKKIRCKTEYLDVDKKGNWIVKKAGSNWDWKQSLTDEEQIKIADISLKIANKLESEVIVMFFIGGNKSIINPKILPWHYSTKEVPKYDQERTLSESLFGISKVIISNKNDLVTFKERLPNIPSKNKLTIVLKLDTDLLRDTKFIGEVGKLAKEHDFYVELIGSILSHVYYVLSRDNVKVKCLYDFDPTYDKLEFNKLVRDKIPDRITSKGEVAKIHKIPPEKLVALLKTKAVEEAFELFYESNSANIVEELADVLEVIRSLGKVLGIDFIELQSKADKKRIERGGFDEGIFLEGTSEVSLIQNINRKQRKNSFPSRKSSEYSNKVISNIDEIIVPLVPFTTRPIFSKPVYIKELDKDVLLQYTIRGLKIQFRTPNQEYADPSQLSLF